MRIGIFDSGLGGLLVFREMRKYLPQYDYLYLGDTKRLPYGNRSQGVLFEFTRQAVDYLFRQNCNLIIIACNTASARALRRIQKEYLPKHFPDRRVLGVIIPTAEESMHVHAKKIGVLGTQSTVDSGSFIKEIEKRNTQATIFQQATPLLVPIIENNDRHLLYDALREYLEPLKQAKIDTLLLGCTHYGIIKKDISDYLEHAVHIVAQENIIPRSCGVYLERHKEIASKLSCAGSGRIQVTDITPHFERTARLWFGDDIELEYVTIEA